ncbi:MAG: glycosyltransferase family 39 protein [Flavobacteriia bacterium]|nr:glycosyltransferase family 39 protein [Flavobacteriia bacterium]
MDYLMRKMFNRKRYFWLGIFFVFIAVELFINPTGNYPLNDDWAYAKTIKYYLDTNHIKISNFIAVPFLTQLIFGVFTCKIFGFSFFVLRLITLFISFCTIAAINEIFKEFSFKPPLRFLLLIFLLLNPIFLYLSNTFLPDIYIVFFSVLAVFFMIKYWKTDNYLFFILFIISSVSVTLTRQIGVTIPFAFFIGEIIQGNKNFKLILLALLPFFITISSLLCYQYFATIHHVLPSNYNLQIETLFRQLKTNPFKLIVTTIYYLLTSCMCLGLMLFPFVLANFKKHILFFCYRKSIFLLLLIGIFVLVKVLIFHKFLPFVGNVFHDKGIGPIIMTGNELETEIPLYLQFFYGLLSCLGLISFCLVVQSCYRFFKPNNCKSQRNFILFFGILAPIYLLIVSLNYANDRYLVFILPLLLICYLISGHTQIKLLLFGTIFIPLSFYVIVSISNNFKIHNCRWKAISILRNELNIPVSKIDGGFEFNAYFLEEEGVYNPTHQGRWWWIKEDTYVVSTKAYKKGFLPVKKLQTGVFLSSNYKALYILRKNDVGTQ